ncbi:MULTISPECIES: porin family protein [unclassified Janthinobacterium]|uniref:porin family protein n=1 Tax=unclassified Janthinobacterium TaxID=2610881 RepID=UPI00181C6595|nr:MULTISPECIES: porin family protein [unclassified Janthinobacterium]MBB5605611.1 OOP family OmpA-OmpF porin [Janthinobacterium sp. S3T4]MBB5611470.1 OOP family OmpA-OmpF porin [Janthinobacterium sp. S3M3]
MMKKILFAMIASVTAVAGMSAAHADGAYVGGGVTVNRYNFDVPDATSAGNHSGYQAGGKIYAGYDIDKTWAVEGGYADFGSKDYNYITSAGSGAVKSDSHGYYLAGKATMPVSEKLGVFGKLGVARVNTGLTGSGLSTGITGDNKTGVYASVGAQYAINEKVSLTAELEHFGKSADQGNKATGLALGARYNF